MNNKKLANAIFMAISEDVLKQLEYDESIGKYVWPEGAIFSIDPKLAQIAAKELGVEMKADGATKNIGRWWDANEFKKLTPHITAFEAALGKAKEELSTLLEKSQTLPEKP